jgi:Cell wall-active antibiotics response 4TMS YvqF
MTNTSTTAKSTTLHLALLGGMARRGSWRMRRRTVAVSPIGGVDLDLTETEMPAEATVVKVSLIGGVKLTVPADVDVQVKGFSLIGGRDIEEGEPGGPVLRVHAYGVFGGVKVRRAAA